LGGAAPGAASDLPRWEERLCQGCDRCQNACPDRSTPKVRLRTAEAVLAQLERARPFLSGLTISGGEPTQQAAFVAELLRRAQAQGLPGLLESNGSAPPEVWALLIPLCEGVLLDLKAFDAELHQRLTGAPVAPTLAAIGQLAAAGKLTEVRHLVIPGYTDAPAHLAALAGWLAGAAPGVPLVLQAFRSHGVKGALAATPSPSTPQLQDLARLAQAQGVAQVSIRPAAVPTAAE
jgi:pyruvate-formate lyase-activating enzyme